MKPSKIPVPRQLQLQWEVDESQIWGSLEPTRQQQLVEHLAQLWIQFVVSQQHAPSTAVSSTHSGQEQHS